jgi:hypothetical protein
MTVTLPRNSSHALRSGHAPKKSPARPTSSEWSARRRRSRREKLPPCPRGPATP